MRACLTAERGIVPSREFPYNEFFVGLHLSTLASQSKSYTKGVVRGAGTHAS